MNGLFRIHFFDSQSDNLKSKIQNRKLVGTVALVVTFAMCGAMAQAQQPSKVPRIGYLAASTLEEARIAREAFQRGC
jgi:hypothetical protein